MRGKATRTRVVQEPAPGYNESAIAIYETPDGVRLDVKLEKETLWLTQKQMADLFQTERSVITKHLRNIYTSGELDQESNVQKMHLAGSDKPVAFHSLDAIISVGYRVNSKRGTQFRIWETSVLRNHLLKGYSVNERRLQELNQTIRLIADVAGRRELSAAGADHIIRSYPELRRIVETDCGRPVPRPVSCPGKRYLTTRQNVIGDGGTCFLLYITKLW
jgi:hypothetical protein